MNKMVKIAILGLFSVATLGAMNMKKEIKIKRHLSKSKYIDEHGLLKRDGAKKLFSLANKDESLGLSPDVS